MGKEGAGVVNLPLKAAYKIHRPKGDTTTL